VRGDEGLSAKAKAVSLGTISMAGQKIVVNKSIVLSRLASSGIDVSDVTLTGANEVSVSRKHQVIAGSEFLNAASEYLKKNLPDDSICHFEPIYSVKDLVVPGEKKKIKLVCSLLTGDKNPGKVRIAAIAGDKKIAVRDTGFRFSYKSRKVVAKKDIAFGEVITKENVKIEDCVSNSPEPEDWKPPYGQIAGRSFQAGAQVKFNMIDQAKPAMVIKRNQNVLIKVNIAGLMISAGGKAMDDDRVGEIIKVQNIDSKRIIIAKVNEDGSVKPAF
jgi:flagella basal body P-ring formation protein FlgA